MAVDQARHTNNFFVEALPTNNNMNSNNNNNMMLSHANMMFLNNNESFLPLCNLNDVVFQQLGGKFSPAVKDDSGVTFNNSVVTRKRPREQISCTQLLSMNPLPVTPMSNTVPNNTATSATSGVVVDKESSGFCFLGEDLSLQIMQQQLELDRLISQHMEKMRMEIEERKKQQVRRIMGAIEQVLRRRLRDKEEELQKIGKINWALEEKVKSLCLENQIWRDLAQTNEAAANALRTNLEQVLQQVKDNVDRAAAAEGTDDAASCCGSSGYGGEEERENEEDDDQQWRKCKMQRTNGVGEAGKNGWVYRGKSGGNHLNNSNGRLCRKCGEGESSVLLLPCRHLCLCSTCGPAVNSCPVCDTTKNASVHVNLS